MLEDALSRGWENLVGRLGGPMSFRFLIQPAVAILFAVRAGLTDARQNEPPFLWAMRSNSGSWRDRLRQVWKDVGTVFIVALILDSIYQVIVHAGIFTLELLITATVLAVVPYVVLRGFVTWIARWAGKQASQPAGRDQQSET
ncbi:MAG TPA: hypothetical protein VG055_31990 [Planctomycetaceae bacterium]|jgi:hypothetical protein|nr:hypothetical protein [Planctomycetaceae bacterium]